jgi:glycosyltransferase involved in cell wall biosynthesis
MVERAVRSVLAQERPPDEIIVVDDASGDETGDRAAALGARVITHEQNQGEGGARNTGLAAAKHEWVALLDCDDEWLPAHLATLWPARDSHVLVGSAALAVGQPEDHRVFGWAGRRPCVMTAPPDVAGPENKLVPSAVMVRRDAALAAGGFRDLRRAADLDMWLRLLEDGTAVAIPRVTALYHVHSGQVSTDQRLMDEAHRAVLDEHAGRPWCTSAMLRRHEGVVAWDTARAAWSEGEPWLGAAGALARRLIHPQRAIGVAQLLVARFMRRRLAATVELPDGAR